MTAHATLNGTITNVHLANVDERGFKWGYSSGSYPYSWTEAGNFGTGNFSHVITGLDLSSTVYFKARAHNSAGWAEGAEKSFATPSPVSYYFSSALTRIVTAPLGGLELTRGGIVVSARKARKEPITGIQPALKVG